MKTPNEDMEAILKKVVIKKGTKPKENKNESNSDDNVRGNSNSTD